MLLGRKLGWVYAKAGRLMGSQVPRPTFMSDGEAD